MKKILITTLSVYDKDRKSFPVNVDLNIANVLQANGVPTLAVSLKRGRLWHTIYCILKMIKEWRQYDIMILPLFGTRNSVLWYRIISWFATILRKKTITIVRGGSIVDRIKEKGNLFIPILEKANTIVTPSLFFQHIFKEKKIESTVIENPITLGKYTFHHKNSIRPRLIWMRTFHDIYNPLMAIDVAAQLVKKYPDFKMVMAGGDKGLLDACKKAAFENVGSNCISFPGYINLQQKNELATDYDIYICTNKVDNAPFSFIEFMAMGVPIVSVPVGGIPYLITHQSNGLLCSDTSVKEMVNQISRLIENPTLASKITAQAYQYVQAYDEAIVAAKWKMLLTEIRKEL